VQRQTADLVATDQQRLADHRLALLRGGLDGDQPAERVDARP
jgi:hypothetical protein